MADVQVSSSVSCPREPLPAFEAVTRHEVDDPGCLNFPRRSKGQVDRERLTSIISRIKVIPFEISC